MEPATIIKDSSEFNKPQFHIPLQIGISKGFDQTYIEKPRFIKIIQTEELNNLRVPYTIEEIFLIRKRIDEILFSSQEVATYQSVTLLNQLYLKTSFKMALLTLIRSKPVAAVKAIGLLIMALSLLGFLLNILFREPLVSPFLILYFFYFGLLMAGMAFIERAQIKKQKNAI